jgi:hypothetical protein
VREGQRIAELEAKIDALQAAGLGIGAEPTAQCPHSAEGDMRALNEGAGFAPKSGAFTLYLSALVTDRAMEAWYDACIA